MNKTEILIIDDKVQIYNLLEITLQQKNYAITEVATEKNVMIITENKSSLDLELQDQEGLLFCRN